MDTFRLDRHFKLWEEDNKSLKRVIFAALVISIALIVKVLVPFVAFTEDKKPVLLRIDALNTDRAAVNERLQTIEKTEQALTGINRYIASRPWQMEKEALVQRYRSLRMSPPPGGIDPGRYQREADETISRIGRELQENIIQPLQQSTQVTRERRSDLERLNAEIESLNRFIKEWEDQHMGVNWYRTLDMKEMMVMGLTKDLGARLNDFTRIVKQEQDEVKQARQAVDNDLQLVNKRIAAEQDVLQKLDGELQSILPQWLRGLVTTEQVLQILPVGLLITAVYVFYIGLSLTRHFSIYADGKAFEESVRTDPVMSSVWTLVPRGKPGTVLTVAAYMLFFIVVWLLLEKSTALLLQWVTIDASRAWIGEPDIWRGFLWLSRLTFIGLIACVGGTLLRPGGLPLPGGGRSSQGER